MTYNSMNTRNTSPTAVLGPRSFSAHKLQACPRYNNKDTKYNHCTCCVCHYSGVSTTGNESYCSYSNDAYLREYSSENTKLDDNAAVTMGLIEQNNTAAIDKDDFSILKQQQHQKQQQQDVCTGCCYQQASVGIRSAASFVGDMVYVIFPSLLFMDLCPQCPSEIIKESLRPYLNRLSRATIISNTHKLVNQCYDSVSELYVSDSVAAQEPSDIFAPFDSNTEWIADKADASDIKLYGSCTQKVCCSNSSSTWIAENIRTFFLLLMKVSGKTHCPNIRPELVCETLALAQGHDTFDTAEVDNSIPSFVSNEFIGAGDSVEHHELSSVIRQPSPSMSSSSSSLTSSSLATYSPLTALPEQNTTQKTIEDLEKRIRKLELRNRILEDAYQEAKLMLESEVKSKETQKKALEFKYKLEIEELVEFSRDLLDKKTIGDEIPDDNYDNYDNDDDNSICDVGSVDGGLYARGNVYVCDKGLSPLEHDKEFNDTLRFGASDNVIAERISSTINRPLGSTRLCSNFSTSSSPILAPHADQSEYGDDGSGPSELKRSISDSVFLSSSKSVMLPCDISFDFFACNDTAASGDDGARANGDSDSDEFESEYESEETEADDDDLDDVDEPALQFDNSEDVKDESRVSSDDEEINDGAYSRSRRLSLASVSIEFDTGLDDAYDATDVDSSDSDSDEADSDLGYDSDNESDMIDSDDDDINVNAGDDDDYVNNGASNYLKANGDKIQIRISHEYLPTLEDEDDKCNYTATEHSMSGTISPQIQWEIRSESDADEITVNFIHEITDSEALDSNSDGIVDVDESDEDDGDFVGSRVRFDTTTTAADKPHKLAVPSLPKTCTSARFSARCSTPASFEEHCGDGAGAEIDPVKAVISRYYSRTGVLDIAPDIEDITISDASDDEVENMIVENEDRQQCKWRSRGRGKAHHTYDLHSKATSNGDSSSDLVETERIATLPTDQRIAKFIYRASSHLLQCARTGLGLGFMLLNLETLSTKFQSTHDSILCAFIESLYRALETAEKEEECKRQQESETPASARPALARRQREGLDIPQQTVMLIAQVLHQFIVERKDQDIILRQLEQLIGANEFARSTKHATLLRVLYQYEIVDRDAIVDWFDGDGDARIRELAVGLVGEISSSGCNSSSDGGVIEHSKVQGVEAW